MSNSLNRIGYAMPIVIVIGLYVTYLVAPEFYLAYILEEVHREQGAVEIVTFWSALISGVLLITITWKLWKSGNWPAVGVIGAVAAATICFAGEEIA